MRSIAINILILFSWAVFAQQTDKQKIDSEVKISKSFLLAHTFKYFGSLTYSEIKFSDNKYSMEFSAGGGPNYIDEGVYSIGGDSVVSLSPTLCHDLNLNKDIDCSISLGKGICKLQSNDTNLYSTLMLIFFPENSDSARAFKLLRESVDFSVDSFEVKEGSQRIFRGTEVVTMGMKHASTTQNVKIRKGPSVSSAELIFTKEPYGDAGLKYVPASTEITVIARTKVKDKVGTWENYWYLVNAGNLKEVWMYGEFIKLPCEEKNSSTAVIYYEKINEHQYNCVKKILPCGEPQTLAQFEEVPYDALWDTAAKKSYFFTPEGVYSINYDQKSEPEKISGKLPDNIYFGTAWVDSASRYFRFSYYLSYSDLNAGQKNKYSELRKKTDYLPSWGDSGIAFISELDTSGNWNIICEDVTKTMAGLTPGFSVLYKCDGEVNTNVISVESFLSSSICMAQVIMNEDVSHIDPKDYEKYNIRNLVKKEVEEFKLKKVSESFDLIFAISYGDTPHYTCPVLLINKETGAVKALTGIAYDQIGIMIEGDYILFGNEYDNSSPQIYSLRSFERVDQNLSATKCFLIGK
jgi:hypothetical protein